MRDPGYKFLSPHNVWCMGKLMYDLLTLAWPFDLEDTMEKDTTEARYYGEYNEHAIPEIKTTKKPEYSNLIRDLIRECLHIKIAKRPTPEQVLERAQRGLEAVMRSSEGRMGNRNGPRLYYMGNEINHMPVGDAGLSMGRADWAAVRGDVFPNPLWQPLLSGRWADEVRGGQLVNQPIEEGGPKRKRRPVHGYVKADPHSLNYMQNRRAVTWKLLSSTLDGEQGKDDEEEQRRQRELDFQDEVANTRQESGPHNGQEVGPTPSINDAASAVDDAEKEAAATQRALEFLQAMAREMVHPNLDRDPRTTANAPTDSSNVNARPPSSQARPSSKNEARLPSNQRQPPSSQAQQQSNQPQPPSNQSQLPSDQSQPPSDQPQPPTGQQPQAPPRQQSRRPRKRRRVMGISIDEDFQEATGRVVRGHNLRKRRG
jgi:hypothetical protein